MSNKYGIDIPVGISDGLKSLASEISTGTSQRVHRYVNRFFSNSIRYVSEDYVYVITGDIEAMWLRDSTLQIWPLFSLSTDNETLKIASRVSKLQAKLVAIDPYANAFVLDNDKFVVFERKYELDSLTMFIGLAIKIYEVSEDASHLQDEFVFALELILDLFEREQDHNIENYTFIRDTTVLHDFLANSGIGRPFAKTGMVWSGFRPSDDACFYNYHIPGNFHAASVLTKLSKLPIRKDLKARADRISSEILVGIYKYGLINDGNETRFAYEVDGLGNQLAIDDANVPSLLSLPYLDCLDADDSIYLTTRRFILSASNPYYCKSDNLSGVGSQHTPAEYVWPLGLAIEGLTTTNINRIRDILETLELIDGGTGDMHESVYINNFKEFTREWFSWADMTYVQLVLWLKEKLKKTNM